ncbi:MAG: DUF1801 domain-containing protein [Spirochaetia bacterium]|nr:DUF1801 domain-containing protein [Spirochaetia bacterium]
MRLAIQKAAPTATEKISYSIPTFYLHENLVHFAGYKNHIGFYPGGSALAEFGPDIKGYVFAKGSIQFPMDQKLPLKLIQKIVKFRVAVVSREYTSTSPFETLAAPAQRALGNAKIKSLNQLSKFTENQIATLHGMGPNALSKLKILMQKQRVKFRKAAKKT